MIGSIEFIDQKHRQRFARLAAAVVQNGWEPERSGAVATKHGAAIPSRYAHATIRAEYDHDDAG
jgi:hypothetical protein